MSAAQGMRITQLDQELAELEALTTRTDWTAQEIARVQEQLPKLLHDYRGWIAQRRARLQLEGLMWKDIDQAWADIEKARAEMVKP